MLARSKRTKEESNKENEGNRLDEILPKCREPELEPMPLKGNGNGSESMTGRHTDVAIPASISDINGQDAPLVTHKNAYVSLNKKKYTNWDPYKARILKRYDFFSQKNKKGAILKTLQFFKARGGIYDGLEYNHIKYWVKQKVEDCEMGKDGYVKKKRGRPPILKEETLKMIDEAILRTVNSGKHLVTSTNLYPIIIRTIKECGEGEKLGEGYHKLKVCSTWINDRCCNLNLSMRKTATSKLPEDREDQTSL